MSSGWGPERYRTLRIKSENIQNEKRASRTRTQPTSLEGFADVSRAGLMGWFNCAGKGKHGFS